MVVSERDGQSVFYSLADRRIIKALREVLDEPVVVEVFTQEYMRQAQRQVSTNPLLTAFRLTPATTPLSTLDTFKTSVSDG